MKLEIRHLDSQATYEIQESGAIMGRERSRTDIAVADKSVSKQHARIFANHGEWYLEDLGSSNGTFLNQQRIEEAVVLMPGALFSLSDNQFEVVRIIREAGEVPDVSPSFVGQRSPEDLSTDTAGDDPGAELVSAVGELGDLDDGDRIDSQYLEGGDVDSSDGFGAALAALPKAAIYYLGAVPLLALNPIGTIRKSIDEQKFEAMGKFELMGWGLPALLFSSLVGWICGSIVALVAGTFSFGNALPIVPVISAVISAVVGGFALHPVLGWIVRKLKGESTAKQRTNYFIISMSATALVALPTGLGMLIGLVPLPFINILPVFLGLAATLLTFFIAYRWFGEFEVVQWFRYLLLALGALACVGSAQALVAAVQVSLAGGGAAVATTDEPTPTDDTPGAEGMSDEDLQAAQEAIKKNQEDAARAEGETPNEGEKDPDPDKKPDPEPDKKPDPEPVKKPDPEPVKKPDPEPVKKPDPKPVSVPKPPPVEVAAGQPTPRYRSGYPQYAAKLAAIEAAVERDPTVLNKGKGEILKLYRKIKKGQYDAAKKYSKKRKKKEAWEGRVDGKLAEADAYKSLGSTVDDLYNALFK